MIGQGVVMAGKEKDMLAYERELWSGGVARIAGVDEAGRGPLAGPVVAGAVVFGASVAEEVLQGILRGLTDSKQLTERRREVFFAELKSMSGVDIGVGMASAAEIDEVNILQATYLAMRRAVAGLKSPPEHILVDGRPVPGLPAVSTAIVKGDSLSLSIAAASIIAKVTRDHIMYELDAAFPQYGFAAHKGYGTKEHLAALRRYGPLPEHRNSFRPVREARAEKFSQMELGV